MSRVYTVVLNGTYTAAGTDTDLLEVVAVDDKPVKLLGFTLGQSTEVGDAAEEGVRLSVIRLPATVTSGTGGTQGALVNVLDSADGTTAMACDVNNTAVATTSGTAVTLCEFGWNIRSSPYEVWFPPRCEPVVKGAEALVIRAQTTVADDISIHCTFWLEEM